MLRIIIFTFLPIIIYAQSHIPEKMKTKNDDLRSRSRLFEIKALKESNDSYFLEILNNQHILNSNNGTKTQRISSEASEKLDKKFVSEFIQLKYGMNRASKSICFKSYELDMRGEKQFICDDEFKKLERVNKLISELKNLISE